jgi:hypothetical protein
MGAPTDKSSDPESPRSGEAGRGSLLAFFEPLRGADLVLRRGGKDVSTRDGIFNPVAAERVEAGPSEGST